MRNFLSIKSKKYDYLGRDGFAIAGVVYSILLLFIILLTSLLVMLGNRKRTLDGINAELVDYIGSSNPTQKLRIKELIESDSAHIVRNVNINGETVNKVVGTKAEKLSMKNYVWFAGNLWQVIETSDASSSIKMVAAQSLTNIAYGDTNAWDTSWMKKWLNEFFLPNTESEGSILSTTFCVDEPTIVSETITDEQSIVTVKSHTKINTCTNKKVEKVGLLTFEDYVYALNGTSANYNGGSFLDDSELTWTMTPYTKGGYNTHVFIHWYTTGYIAAATNETRYGNTNRFGLSVRPVISIRGSNIVVGGDGTKANPYQINEVHANKDAKINSVRVGDYVYLDESNNPNTFTSEFVAKDLSFPATKDKVRYRVIKKSSSGNIRVERADVLRNLPATVAIKDNVNVQYYSLDTGTSSTSCRHNGTSYYTNGCADHNYFLPDDGSGAFAIDKQTGNNIGYFLNNATNSFYSWFSDKTKSMLYKGRWPRYTGGNAKDYANLNSDPSITTYPARTDDGDVYAYVGLPTWGEMYTGNDLGASYWYINRWPDNSYYVSRNQNMGVATGNVASSVGFAVRPVVVIKNTVKIADGNGTMTNPYTLAV